MAVQKTTPEEKLFAVIQGASFPSPRARAPILSIGAVFSRAHGALSSIDLPRVNQALLIAIVLLGACALVAPLLMQPQMDRVLQEATKQQTPFVMAPPLEGLSSAEESVQHMRTQDPFRVGEATPAPLAIPAPTGAIPGQPPPGTDARSLLADFRLVGISRGAVTTVMIEQISQNKTSILKVDDQIDQFTVKEILTDRVILQVGSGPEEVDLF